VNCKPAQRLRRLVVLVALGVASLGPVEAGAGERAAVAPLPPVGVPGDFLEFGEHGLDQFLATQRVGGEPLRVVHFGDSHSAHGVFASVLRDRLAASAPATRGGGAVGHPLGSQGAFAAALRATLAAAVPPAPGFVSVGHPVVWDARVRAEGEWETHNWLRRRHKGPFGPHGVARTTEDPSARMTLKIEPGFRRGNGTSVTVLYANRGYHLPFRIEAGGNTLARVVATKSQRGAADSNEVAGSLGRVTVALPEGTLKASLSVDCQGPCPKGAELRVFGWLVDNDAALVTWDNLSIGGTTIFNITARADQDLEQFLEWRRPNLVVILFGTNFALDARWDPVRYAKRWKKLLVRLQGAAPGASFLLVTPPDFVRQQPDCFMTESELSLVSSRRGRRKLRAQRRKSRRTRICSPDLLVTGAPGKLVYPAKDVETQADWDLHKARCVPVTVPELVEIVEIEKKVAGEMGLAVFDTFGWMGGEQSLTQWTCNETQLASSDMIHLTRDGYTRLGKALYTALKAVGGRVP